MAGENGSCRLPKERMPDRLLPCFRTCFAPLQTYWLLLAISQDQPRNKHVAAVRDRCEQAALEGFWVRGRAQLQRVGDELAEGRAQASRGCEVECAQRGWACCGGERTAWRSRTCNERGAIDGKVGAHLLPDSKDISYMALPPTGCGHHFAWCYFFRPVAGSPLQGDEAAAAEPAAPEPPAQARLSRQSLRVRLLSHSVYQSSTAQLCRSAFSQLCGPQLGALRPGVHATQGGHAWVCPLNSAA